MNPVAAPEISAPRGFVYIYMLGTEDGREVKLGHTTRTSAIRRREHELNAGRVEPLRTLAVMLGAKADERALIHFFRPYVSRERSGEWIKANGVMRDYLRFLRDKSFVARDDSLEEMDRLEVMPSSEWLPGEDHAKRATQMTLETSSDPWGDIFCDEEEGGDFYSAPALVAPARMGMGGIDLDPCSCRKANDVVRADRFFNERENGLLHDWWGRIWLNPPGGIWTEWAPKLLDELSSGRVEQVCAGLSSRSLTDVAVHPLVQRAAALVIPRGRIPNWGPKATASPNEGWLVLYFGPYSEAIATVYRPIGTTLLAP